MHAELAEMIRGDARDDGDVGPRDREPAPQDSAARGFEDGGLDARIAQHAPRAGGPRVVAGAERLSRDEDAVRAAIAGGPPGRLRTGGEQPHDGRLAIGAGDERRRNAVQRAPGARRRRRAGRPRGQLWPPAPAPSVRKSSSARTGRLRALAASMKRAQARIRFARRAAPQPQERAGLVEHRRLRFLRLLGGERRDEYRRVAKVRAPQSRQQSAHSLTSVAVKSWSVGAASASDAPVRWATAHSGAAGQRSSLRARRTRRSHSRSTPASRSSVSSTAPGPSKNRL